MEFLPRWCACRSWWGRRWVSWGAPSLDRETCGVSWPAWRECPRGSPAEPHRQPRHPRHQPHCIPRRAWAPRPPGARKGAHRRFPSSRSLKAPGDKRINAWRRPKSTHFDTPHVHVWPSSWSEGYVRQGASYYYIASARLNSVRYFLTATRDHRTQLYRDMLHQDRNKTWSSWTRVWIMIIVIFDFFSQTWSSAVRFSTFTPQSSFIFPILLFSIHYQSTIQLIL